MRNDTYYLVRHEGNGYEKLVRRLDVHVSRQGFDYITFIGKVLELLPTYSLETLRKEFSEGKLDFVVLSYYDPPPGSETIPVVNMMFELRRIAQLLNNEEVTKRYWPKAKTQVKKITKREYKLVSGIKCICRKCKVCK